MLRDPAGVLLDRAKEYQRTALAAAVNKDLNAAFENARTAAELAAKSMLVVAQHGYGKDHNVAPALVKTGLWPAGRDASKLSRFLGAYARGVYGLAEPVEPSEAQEALAWADRLVREASRG